MPPSPVKGQRAHFLPPRAFMNDNQLMPGGPGHDPSAQALGLPLATNLTVNVGPPISLTSAIGPTTPRLGDWKKGRPRKTLGSPHPQLQPMLEPVQIRCKGQSTLGFQASESVMSLGWEEGGKEDQQRWAVRGLSGSSPQEGRRAEETTAPDAPRPSCCPFPEDHLTLH